MGTESEDFDPSSIAIVGLAGRFPAARSPAELWALLRHGREATRWLTPQELRAAGVPEADITDPDYVPASLVLPDMEMFDAEFFGFSKRDAAVLDPQHRHFLECAWEALEDAGHMPENFPGAIGVFGGCGMQAYLPYNLLTNPQLVKSMGLFLLRHTGNDKDFLCSRVSYLLDLKGPSLSIQTACSTSLVAVHVAAQSLLAGECDMALAGGVSIELPHGRGYRHAEGEILSPDGHCRAFDDSAAGTLFGSGAGIVVLRRLDDAVRDGDNIYAVIRGSAVNNDGSQKAGYLAPSVEGQARAAVEALAVAGIEPGSVSYIEAHGTGTPVGDPIELAALAQAYGAGGRGFCGIGSLKSNIGHLDAAAGVASLIKVSLALRHGLIPASLNFSRPNSRIDMAATPFQVVHQARPWARGDAPRRAAVNSLGVGGTNAHVIVEEPPLIAGARAQEEAWQVLALSARSAASLERLKEKWSGFLAEPPDGFSLADAAYTTQVGRRAFEHRCAVVARDLDSLRAALQGKAHARCAAGKAAPAEPGVVLMFPGGGTHYPGAGAELLGQPAFLQAVNECFALMPADAPADLRSVMFDSDSRNAQAAGKLEQPSYAIPALFTLEYALAKLWESWGVRPAAVIGHSAGEYAAACIAGAMPLQDALAVVVLRGRLFEAAPSGGMLSVDLSEQQLRELMDGLALDIAAINADDLCIASGSLAAIGQLEQRLAQRGAEGRRLRINVAAHSRLLDGVLDAFRERVSRIRFSAPSIPFISNLTGSWADAKALADPEYWVRHLREPVRFSDGLRQLLEMRDTILVEAGPGQGLCSLARQNRPGQPQLVLASTGKAQEPRADLALMLQSAGALWARGKALDWETVRTAGKRRRVSLPTYAFDHERHWVEPGLGREQAAAPVAPLPAPPHGLKRLPAMDDWFSAPEWKPVPLPVAQPQTARRWLVFGNESRLTAAMLAQAAADGAGVTLVRRGETFTRMPDGSFTLAATEASHYTDLFRTLEQSGALPDNILQLWPLDTMPGTSAGQLAGQTLAFDSLLAIARVIQELDLAQPMRLTVVVAGSQAVKGEPVPHPERALALGPCRVIPREIPNISTRLVELEPFDVSSEAVARAIRGEAQHPDACDLVAYRDGQRWVPQLVAARPRSADAAQGARSVRHGGVYLITGGLGEIALDLAGWLAQAVQARLALVSRRALPPRASWPALAASGDHSPEVRLVRRLLALEEHGAQVQAFSADVADRNAMAAVVSACRARFGAINGVFHAAGVLDDGPIATKNADSVQRVLGAKACGAQVLHELLPPGDLDVFAVFSSTSVYLGPPGQVDYVAANAYLAALAASRGDGFCVHWGIWGEKGMAARASRRDSLAHEAPRDAHPLLGVQVGSDNGADFEANYASSDLWVLREHSVAGRAVLPGTAYIEMARAAMMVLHPKAAIEIRSLSFEEPMVFDPASTRRVRVELRRSAAAYDFSVQSRGELDEEWLEHARAGVSVFLGSLPAASSAPNGGEWRAGAIPQEHALAFGARWRNIVRMRMAGREATAQLELPREFAGDLAQFGAHPALTDMAATFGLHLLDAAERERDLFVPLSIDRVRLVAPVPGKLISRAQLKSGQARLAAFDVSLHTPDGAPIATFEGFALRGVKPDVVSLRTAPRRQPSLMDSMLACGIRGEDTHELFARVFAGSAGRDIVVSSIDIADLHGAIAGAAPKALPRKPAGAEAADGGARLNPVEQAIAEIWRELLGVETVGVHDDFFALGGHSLAAVRLFARIRKQFAVDLPLATLFQAPTLGGLAAIVAESGGLDTGENAPASKKAASNVFPLVTRSWSPLVAICRGRPERTPLFCVHGAGGNVLNFKIISDRLGQEQPFYGLQAQGVDGRLPPLASIEEMAAQYVDAIRGADAHGPYRLAGYSAGGLIALEMAQQLKKAGAAVELLAMIDTLSPTAARRKVSSFTKLWLMRHWSLKFALDWPSRRRRGKQADAIYAQALERLGRGEPLPPELVEFHLFRNFVAAQARYEPAPYEGSIALFKATQADTQYLGAGDSLGWDEHIRGEIRVTGIAGSHFTMMAEPGVSELIEAFERELARLDERPPSPQTRVA